MLLVVLYPRVGRLLHYDTAQFAIWVAIAFLFASLAQGHLSDYLRFTGRIGLANLQNALLSYGTLALILLARHASWRIDATMLVGCQGLAALLVTLPFASILLSETSPSLARVTTNAVREEVTIGFPMTVSYVAEALGQSCDRYALGALGSSRRLCWR